MWHVSAPFTSLKPSAAAFGTVAKAARLQPKPLNAAQTSPALLRFETAMWHVSALFKGVKPSAAALSTVARAARLHLKPLNAAQTGPLQFLL